MIDFKKTIKSNKVVYFSYDFIKSFFSWILNYIVSIIPIWFIRKTIYRLYGMKIGKGARIGIYTKVICPSKIIIGNRSIVNEHCHLDGRGGLIIGDDCSISIYSKIITASHKSHSASFEYYENGITIEDHVWVGCNAIILDGSILKTGCIIGAGAVIKAEVPEKEIYIGNPARKVKDRESNLEYKIDFRPFFK